MNDELKFHQYRRFVGHKCERALPMNRATVRMDCTVFFDRYLTIPLGGRGQITPFSLQLVQLSKKFPLEMSTHESKQNLKRDVDETSHPLKSHDIRIILLHPPEIKHPGNQQHDHHSHRHQHHRTGSTGTEKRPAEPLDHTGHRVKAVPDTH